MQVGVWFPIVGSAAATDDLWRSRGWVVLDDCAIVVTKSIDSYACQLNNKSSYLFIYTKCYLQEYDIK